MKSLLLMMAFQYLNTPYKWGGNNCDGFDCSGFVLRVLKDVDINLPDMTSKSLHSYFSRLENKSSKITTDSILFFGKNEKSISHVAIAIDSKYMIEAGGAGKNSLVESSEKLAKDDARVRIKPISNRKDLISVYNIKY